MDQAAQSSGCYIHYCCSATHRITLTPENKCKSMYVHSVFSIYTKFNTKIIYVAVEVRKRTLYRKLILRKWRLKFSNDFDVIVDVVLDCLVYACKKFNGHSARLCFMCVRRCIVR